MPDETTQKRIRLDVQSGVIDLLAITKTISGLKTLTTVATEATTALTSLQKITGIDLSTLGKGAGAAAAQVKTATASIAGDIKNVKSLSDEVSKSVAAIGGKPVKTSTGVTAYAGGARTKTDIDIQKDKNFNTERTQRKWRYNQDLSRWEEESFGRTVTHNPAKLEDAKQAEAAEAEKTRYQDALKRQHNANQAYQAAQEAEQARLSQSERMAIEAEKARYQDTLKRQHNANEERRAVQEAEQNRLAQAEMSAIEAEKARYQETLKKQHNANRAYQAAQQAEQDRLAKQAEDSAQYGESYRAQRAANRKAWKTRATTTRNAGDSQIAGNIQGASNARMLALASLGRAPSGVGSSASISYWQSAVQAHQQFVGALQTQNSKIGPAVAARHKLAQQLANANAALIRAQQQLARHQSNTGGFWDRIMGGVGGRGGTAGLQRGLSGWTPGGMVKNAITAGGWMTAVSGFFAVTRTIGYSIERMAKLEYQTARLSQVFRGVGGNARELTGDVLNLAAANGRGSEEAVESAIAWSRLGLTKRQAAEATRVSLMAANVAEMDSAEATQRMAAVMSAYKLQVTELESALGALNQLSNTYRVTNKDLLEGLSRVSSVAQQGGMSFAELSSILAVTVQKTGQTGANMSNAIKTVMVRMNRPDVKEFFGNRFNMDVDGTAQSLRAVWNQYSKVNSEQRQDIMLKIGGATQANRFRAIMESYSESIWATVDALKNLGSAESENAKITNTAMAAKQRLISSWDRLANSPTGAGGVANLLNAGAGAVAGLTNALPSFGSQSKPMYFNADNAKLWPAALGWLSPGLLRLPYMQRKLGFSTDPTSIKDKFQVSMQKIYDTTYGAQAEEHKSGYLKNLANNFNAYTPESKKQVLDSLKNRVPDAVLAQMQQGDMSGLLAESAKSKQASQDALRDASERLALAIKAKEVEIATTKDLDQRKELESQLNEMKRKQSSYDDAFAESLEKSESAIRQMNRLLSQQQSIVRDIASTFAGMGLSNYAKEMLTLTEAIEQTKGIRDTKGLSEGATAELNARILELENRQTYLRSGAGIARGIATRNREVATEYYGAQIDNQGVGLSRGEQLLAKRDWLNQQIKQLPKAEVASQDDRIRAQEIWMAAKQTEFDISKRILENERERKQLMLETNKEFQKSLIGAGPSEILRKLTAARMSRNGVNAGQFWSMSPDMRQDIYGLRGGSRMAELNTEARALSGQGGNLSDWKWLAEKVDDKNTEYARQYSAAVESAASIATSLQSAMGYAQDIMRAFAGITPPQLQQMQAPRIAPTAASPPQMSDPGPVANTWRYSEQGSGRSGSSRGGSRG